MFGMKRGNGVAVAARGLAAAGLVLGWAAWAGAQTAPAASTAAAAQTSATVAAPVTGTRVHGTITDPDGDLIPGATITLTPAAGKAQTVKSGSDGTYTVLVRPGTFTLVVTMPGFSSYSATGVKIPAVGSLTLDAKLQVGVADQVVNVEADAVQLSVDPDSNASAQVISGKDLEALSDDPDELSSELTALAGPSAGPNGGQIYVDGFTGGQLPPKSSIREIRINQNPFSAQFDRLGYGRVEVFTKPGTDKLHGSFQLNFNPSQFNSANPLEATSIPSYHTLFGFGSVTGPLAKWASYSIGGSYRDIEDDEFTNAYLPVLPGSTTLCAPGTVGCTATYNYQQATYNPQHREDISPRLDLAFGQKNVLTVRYQFVNNTGTNSGTGNLALPTTASNTTSLSNELQLSDTQTFSPKLINETRFEYEREHSNSTAQSTAPSVNVSGLFSSGGSSGQSSSTHQDHFELQNYTSIQLAKNFIRLGGRLRADRYALNSNADTNGSFTYATQANYVSGTASQFSFTQINVPNTTFTVGDIGLYAESDWKARQNLTISYGVRFEAQNHLPADHHDFAPRLSFAYGLGSGKGTPKTVLRGGYGIFYDRFAAGNVQTLERENGKIETVYTVSNPTSACTPGNLAACKAQALPQTQTLYTKTTSLRTPYIQEAALGVDQQLGRIGTLSMNYIHSQGVHEIASQNINYQGALSPTGGPVYQYFSEGVFRQDQLVVNGRAQLAKWFSLFGYYSLGRAKGDTSGNGGFISTPGNIAADYGRTGFDVRNRIFMAGSVTLPHTIQLSPFMIGQTGNPYNVTVGSDLNGDTQFNDRPDLVNSSLANGSTIKTIGGCGTFALPSAAPAGSSLAPINPCTGPGLFTLNLRATKTFGFGPSRNAQASQGGQGGQRGGPPGGGSRGGGGGGGSRGGGGPMFFGGGSTGKLYNLTVGLQVENLFNNENLATPIAVLNSSQFGQSTQVTGRPYTSDSALRKISVQASFSF